MFVRMNTVEADSETPCDLCGSPVLLRADFLGLYGDSGCPVCLGCGDRTEPALASLLRLAHAARLYACVRVGETEDEGFGVNDAQGLLGRCALYFSGSPVCSVADASTRLASHAIH